MTNSASAFPPSSVHVVIAEDSRIQAKILQKHLVDAGCQVRVAPNGAEALKLIQEEPPTIIISDIEMPEMNGYELCRRVKEDPQLRRIPLILLSTLSAPEDIIKGLHAGADNYVTKPYQAHYLLSRVESLLDTPVGEEDPQAPTLEVTLAGKHYQVRSGRQQVLNLLISTFENAVEKNNELIRVNQELTVARDQLTRWNQDLTQLNEKLETANTRMSRDLAAAAKIQQSLLPATTDSLTQVDLAWRFIPCDELAGDFLNYFMLDERHLALFVVDVSGHGVASSLLSVTVGRVLTPQVSSSSLLVRQSGADTVPQIVPPADVMAELNRRFPMEEQGGLYFTIGYGVLDLETGQLRYAAGGHPPLVVLSAEGNVQTVDPDGMAVGWMEDVDFEEINLQLQPGDRVFMYSDGVPEAMDGELNEFSDQRMLERITTSRETVINDSVGALLQAVQKWCGRSGPKDDVSILALEFNPVV
ncbi:MAG: SpoIIE family protein phosphatase [Pirellulaceae bacterium]